MDGISDVDTSSLSKAIQQRDFALIKLEADKLKSLGKQILSLKRLDDPMQVAKDYSMADAISVNKAVESRLARESTELFARRVSSKVKLDGLKLIRSMPHRKLRKMRIRKNLPSFKER